MSGLRRIRWRCRRGVRELDLALTRFLDAGFHELSREQGQVFDRLLDEPDPVLLDWILGGAEPPDRGRREIIEAIRAASASPRALL